MRLCRHKKARGRADLLGLGDAPRPLGIPSKVGPEQTRQRELLRVELATTVQAFAESVARRRALHHLHRLHYLHHLQLVKLISCSRIILSY